MHHPSLVIFDCDGVLVDSERLSHSVLRDMLGEFGVELTLDETLEHFMGTSTEKCLEVLNTLIGKPAPEDFFHQFKNRTFESFAKQLLPVEGAPELLATLQVPYCVASNGPREKMRFTLGHTGLLPFVDGRLFSAQDVARPKPAPDLFLHAAASLGASAGGCVVVEDSPTGVAAARAAGMVVYGFAAMGQSDKLRHAGAQVVFSSMGDLPALLGSAR
jgi:HAD superfamily hydrolase (TIGR01509 family)